MEMSSVLVVSVLATAGAAAGFFVWLRIVARLSEKQPVLPTSPRFDVPWRGVHVALAFFLYVVLPGMSVFLVRWRFDIPWPESIPNDDIDIAVLSLAALSVLSVIATLLVVTYMKIDLAASSSDLGWARQHVLRDIVTGVLAFLAIAPPVYALQMLLITIYEQFSEEPPTHPLIKLVEENPTPDIIFWSCVSAVLVAPVVEEFLFRVVLQGWLEKLVRIGQRGTTAQGNPSNSPPRSADQPPDSNPYASPSTTEASGLSEHQQPSAPKQLMLAPILVSSVLFSFFHFGHGPAPIPLFFLALVLGYLYQKTHRILPSVVVHTALNGSSMLVLWLNVGQ